MNCLKCGSWTTADQKFCRSCGAGLQIDTKPLNGPFRSSDSESILPIASDTESRPTNTLVRLAAVAMFAGLIIAIFSKMFLHIDVVTFAGVATTLIGMFVLVYSSLTPRRRLKRTLIPSPQPQVLTKAEPTKKLAPATFDNIDFIPSVTEKTTDLLRQRPGP